LTFFLIGGTQYSLKKAYAAIKVGEEQQQKILQLISLCFAFWLLITGLLADGGYYNNYKYFFPRLLVFGLLPPIIIIVLLLFSKPFTRILQVIPPSWLVKGQSFRIILEGILWLSFIGDFMPFQMTFLGFNMDIIAGITALLAGAVFFRKGRFMRRETLIWNVFGILLLINLLFILTVSMPSVLRKFMNEPSSEIISLFPFIWIPTFIVPFALAMHLFSLKQVFIKDLQPFGK
jgi:hypothetical protein